MTNTTQLPTTEKLVLPNPATLALRINDSLKEIGIKGNSVLALPGQQTNTVWNLNGFIGSGTAIFSLSFTRNTGAGEFKILSQDRTTTLANEKFENLNGLDAALKQLTPDKIAN